MSKLSVVINGKNMELENTSTIEELVAERSVSGMFVIEKNKEIIQKEDYANTPVKENDVLEIVGFFGGG